MIGNSQSKIKCKKKNYWNQIVSIVRIIRQKHIYTNFPKWKTSFDSRYFCAEAKIIFLLSLTIE